MLVSYTKKLLWDSCSRLRVGTTFYQLMDNETDAFFIGSVIDKEASRLGLSDAQKERFKANVRLARKTGSVPNTYDGFLYQSVAGYVSLPLLGGCTGQGVPVINAHREFVYGVFINKATRIEDGTVQTAARELLRSQIHSALKVWKDCSLPLRLREDRPERH